MYSQDKIEAALKLYHQCGSVTKTTCVLGYPSKKELYNWILNEGVAKPARKKLLLVNTAEHPGTPPFESKMEAIRRCFELGESIKSLSEEIAIPEPAFTAGCCGIRSPGREGVSFCVCGLL